MDDNIQGLRLLITGKTRSGKSTALHRMICHSLRAEDWDMILLFDGKGSELAIYKDVPGVTYCGPEDTETWAELLEKFVKTITERYAKLTEAGLTAARRGDPRHLVIIDEVQRGTRQAAGGDKKTGRRVRDALGLIFEQSAALGDCCIITSQRALNSMPPTVRENSNAKLYMLGLGYFQYTGDGAQTIAGRVERIERETCIEWAKNAKHAQTAQERRRRLTRFLVPDILGAKPVEDTRAPARLLLGGLGSGRTFRLRASANGHRVIYADFGQPQRSLLLSIIEQAGAVPPPKNDILALGQAAALAMRAEPSTFLADNVDFASEKAIANVLIPLVNAASDCTLAADDSTPLKQRKLKPLLPRCKVERLKALTPEEARALIWSRLNRADYKDPVAIERRLTTLAEGHPGTLASLCDQVKTGSLPELRELQAPKTRISIMWVALLAALFALYVFRWNTSETLLAAALFVLTLFARRLLFRHFTQATSS